MLFKVLAILALTAVVLAQAPTSTCPTPPVLPNAYTCVFSEHIVTPSSDVYSNGYIYFDYDKLIARADTTFPGGMISMLIDYANQTETSTINANGAITCSTSPYNIPMFPPSGLQNFEYAGVKIFNGVAAYGWSGSLSGLTLTFYTDTETGVPVGEEVDGVAFTFQEFVAGVPDNVFTTACPLGDPAVEYSEAFAVVKSILLGY